MVLSLISSRVPVSTPPPSEPDSLEAVKVEEAKFEAISNTILEDSSLYRDSKTQSFNQTEFWANQKASLPLHYALWTAEVGCATNTLDVILTLISIVVKRATCAYSMILCGRGFTRSHEECGCRTAPKR